MNNKMFDALEYCLQALEDGAELESVLVRFPDFADELRPILEASIAARGMKVPEPSPEVMRRGRAQLLQRAAELRETKAAPRPRMIPVFQRLSLALTIAAVFLLSGTGLVRASSTALPGENLYPVKRTWEGVRLLFVFDEKMREALKSEYENERLDEVNDLLVEGRDETIQFAGVLMNVNGVNYVSGIRVEIVPTTQLPVDALQNGAAVIVTGHTNAEGFVEAEAIDLLPPGSVVPVGKPVEVETGTENDNSSGSGSGNEAGGSNENSEPKNQSFQIEGTVEEISNNVVIVNGQTVYLGQQVEIKGVLVVGVNVKVEGYYAPDGRFIVTKLEVEESESNNNSGSLNSNDTGDDNSNSDDSNDDNGNDDNSKDDNGNDGSGHGGGDDNNNNGGD